MDALIYKNYTWPHNPHTYQETLSREPLYTTQSGVTTYSGMSFTHRVITGSGVFYGEKAYVQFQELIDLAEDSTPGNLEHPLWGTRYCYFTKLELTQEPKKNYVSYSFEFTQAKSDGTVPR